MNWWHKWENFHILAIFLTVNSIYQINQICQVKSLTPPTVLSFVCIRRSSHRQSFIDLESSIRTFPVPVKQCLLITGLLFPVSLWIQHVLAVYSHIHFVLNQFKRAHNDSMDMKGKKGKVSIERDSIRKKKEVHIRAWWVLWEDRRGYSLKVTV